MKQRKFPNKSQNLYGNKCSLYEADGGYYCPAPKKDMDEILKICKGNRHNCCKVLYRLNASK